MSTLELRHIITEHISHIDDEPFLNAVKTIIESKVSDGIYKLNNSQKERIDIARHELNNRQTIMHEDLQKEINEWLSVK